MEAGIQQRWQALCSRYSDDAALIDKMYVSIRKRYSTSSRHYHSLHHIAHLLHMADYYAQELKEKDMVDFAIFFHDIIYNVLRKDNEQRSAIYAMGRLTELKVSGNAFHKVPQLILATQTHSIDAFSQYEDFNPHPIDLAFFLDFDMAILGTPWEQYETYTRQVRKEYRIYPDLVYKPGRKAFLQKTLQSPAIFHTELFRQQYEATARQNMVRELQAY